MLTCVPSFFFRDLQISSTRCRITSLINFYCKKWDYLVEITFYNTVTFWVSISNSPTFMLTQLHRIIEWTTSCIPFSFAFLHLTLKFLVFVKHAEADQLEHWTLGEHLREWALGTPFPASAIVVYSWARQCILTLRFSSQESIYIYIYIFHPLILKSD